MVNEVDDRISLDTFGDSGSDTFKMSSIITCLLASHFSWESRCAEEVMWLGQISLSSLPFALQHLYNILSPFFLSHSVGQQAVHIKANAIN
jgi:hypothetical protein